MLHSQMLLQDNDKVAAIQAGVRDPERIFRHAETRRLLNFDEPIGLLTLLLWHFIPDSEDPFSLLAHYRDRPAHGSYLALTHLTGDGKPPGLGQVVDEVRWRGGDYSPISDANALLYAGIGRRPSTLELNQ